MLELLGWRLSESKHRKIRAYLLCCYIRDARDFELEIVGERT